MNKKEQISKKEQDKVEDSAMKFLTENQVLIDDILAVVYEDTQDMNDEEKQQYIERLRATNQPLMHIGARAVELDMKIKSHVLSKEESEKLKTKIKSKAKIKAKKE